MTTIACNRRTLSADTQVTAGGLKYNAVKIQRIGDSIIGLCGDVANGNKFIEWFRLGKPVEKPDTSTDEDDGFSALELNAHGIFRYDACTEPDRIIDRFAAVGTGAPFAYAAMARGETPSQAVKFAHKFDAYTGGKVMELSLPQTKRSTPRKKGTDAKKPTAPRDTGHTDQTGGEAGSSAVGGAVRGGEEA